MTKKELEQWKQDFDAIEKKYELDDDLNHAARTEALEAFIEQLKGRYKYEEKFNEKLKMPQFVFRVAKWQTLIINRKLNEGGLRYVEVIHSHENFKYVWRTEYLHFKTQEVMDRIEKAKEKVAAIITEQVRQGEGNP